MIESNSRGVVELTVSGVTIMSNAYSTRQRFRMLIIFYHSKADEFDAYSQNTYITIKPIVHENSHDFAKASI